MKTQNAFFDFSGGVKSPRMSAKADTRKYQSSLLTGQNFLISPQGGAIMRQGFEFIEETNKNKMFQFHQGGNESDIIVEFIPTNGVGDGEIHFHGDSTISIPSITGHSYDSTALEDLYFTNQERYAVCCHPDYPPIYLEQLLDGTFTLEILPANLIPIFDYQDVNSPAASGTQTAVYTINFTDGDVNTWKDGSGWTFEYDGVYAKGNQGNIKEFEFFLTNTAEVEERLEKACSFIPSLAGADTTYSAAFISSGAGVYTYALTITGPNSGKELVIESTRTSADRFVSVLNSIDEEDVVEPAWSYPTYVTHSGTYYQCIKVNTADATNEPPNAEYWTALAGKPETFDWQYPDGNEWAAATPTDSKNYSPEGRGFPSICVFHYQRLIMAAPPQATTSIFGSRIGFYKDFIYGVQDDDPFSFTLDTSDTPSIKWMSSQLELIVGTSAGDWRIGAAITLGPADIQANKQNYARSHQAVPVVIDNEVFYIEQGMNKVRMTTYQRQQLGFVSRDISVDSESLFHEGVKKIVILRTPEVVMFLLRNDGALVMMNYGVDEGDYRDRMSAVYSEVISQGYVHDIAAYYSTVSNQDELYATMSYDYSEEGPNQYYLERMPYPSRTMEEYTYTDGPLPTLSTPLTEQGVICLDSWITATCTNNLIEGLDHLANKEVGILVDDAWTGIYTVAADGTVLLADPGITVTDPYNGIAAVGYTYTGTLKTFEVATGYDRGTGLGTKRKWNKLYARLLDSSLPTINGILPDDRTPEMQMGIAEILRMGLQDVHIRSAGWNDGSITIVQDRPYPTHIVGLFGEYNAEQS